MKRVIGFYRMFLHTLFPSSYEGFAESTKKNTFKYYTLLALNAFIVMLIVMIPALIAMPSTVESYFSNVNTFNISNDFRTESPILIPKENPLIMINYENNTPTESANIILNNNVLHIGVLWKQYTKDLRVYKEILAQKPAISKFLVCILILIAPTVLLITFSYIYIYYFIIALLASLIGMIASKIMGYKVKYKNMFNCSMYGISLTMFLSLIFFAIRFNFYYIQYLPLLFYVLYSIPMIGEKVDKKMKGRYLEVKG